MEQNYYYYHYYYYYYYYYYYISSCDKAAVLQVSVISPFPEYSRLLFVTDRIFNYHILQYSNLHDIS